MSKKNSVWIDPKPGRVNIWATREVKALIKAKVEKDPNFNFSEYVQNLILRDEKGWTY